jgi:hypothetical protein
MIYTIKNCTAQELPLLQDFIQNYWKKNHPVAVSKALMDFQHLVVEHNIYNFLISINENTKEIDGVLGYIPSSHYDFDLYDDGLFWGVIWKIKPIVEDRMLGLNLLFKVFTLSGFKSYAAIGISNIAKQIYTALKCKMGYLNHYYLLNESLNTFRIAQNVKFAKQSDKLNPDYCIKSIDLDEDIIIESSTYPKKTIRYFKNRYAKHPIYKYLFYGIFHQDKIVTILSVREISVNNSTVLRIVDVIGELTNLPCLYTQFQLLLKCHNAEYVDMLNYGVDKNAILNIGFEDLDFNGNLIIPNYFEPFEQKNVKIEFAYKTPFEQFVIFKGDSDQDRPNIL